MGNKPDYKEVDERLDKALEHNIEISLSDRAYVNIELKKLKSILHSEIERYRMDNEEKWFREGWKECLLSKEVKDKIERAKHDAYIEGTGMNKDIYDKAKLSGVREFADNILKQSYTDYTIGKGIRVVTETAIKSELENGETNGN